VPLMVAESHWDSIPMGSSSGVLVTHVFHLKHIVVLGSDKDRHHPERWWELVWGLGLGLDGDWGGYWDWDRGVTVRTGGVSWMTHGTLSSKSCGLSEPRCSGANVMSITLGRGGVGIRVGPMSWAKSLLFWSGSGCGSGNSRSVPALDLVF